MKKRMVSLWLAAILCLSLMPMRAYAANPPMQNVSLTGDILSWDAVPGADSYNVRIGPSSDNYTETSCNLKDKCDYWGYSSDDYALELYAEDAGGTVLTETWSGTYHYVSTQEKLAMPQNLRFEGNVCKWDAVPHAVDYTVVLLSSDGGQIEIKWPTETQQSFSLETGKTYKFQVFASAPGYITSDPAESALYTYAAPVTYIISYDANGGTVSPATAVTGTDGKLSSLSVPSRSGSYSFSGWYTAASGGTRVTVDKVYAADTTIYAHWTYTGGGSSGGGGGSSSGGGGGSSYSGSSFAVSGQTYSPNWFCDEQGVWRIKNSAGQIVTNAWLCDDVIKANGKAVWYLLGQNGAMVSAGLVQDNTGNFYSLETEHNGYFGMLRYQNGTYNCNGQQVYLTFNHEHNGSFGAVTNAEGLEKLKAIYGATQYGIGNESSVYTSSF